MCIIVAKKKGVNIPSNDILKTCFTRNSDGAGLMYNKDNKVIIEKGFMTYDKLEQRLTELKNEFKDNSLKKIGLVLHFRIGTQGKNDAFTCHPFMISDNNEDLRKLVVETDVAMVHNGIISAYSTRKEDDLSDTQLFIKYMVNTIYKYDKEFYKDTKVMNMLQDVARSRLCFLDKKGDIYTSGDFITDNDILYSNTSYKKIEYSNYSYYGYYDDYDYDFMWSKHRSTKTKTSTFKVKKGNKIKYFNIPSKYAILSKKFKDFGSIYEVTNSNYLLGTDKKIYLRGKNNEKTILFKENEFDLYDNVDTYVNLDTFIATKEAFSKGQ